MSLENLKSRNDLSVDEINLLMDNENNTKMYKKLSYFRFKALGFTKKESYKLAGIKKSNCNILGAGIILENKKILKLI